MNISRQSYRITGFLNLWVALILVIPAAATAEPTLTYEARVVVESVESEAKAKSGPLWKSLTLNESLKAEAEIKTSNKGTVRLKFGEGSTVELKPDTEIKLDSLHDPQNQPLIWILLKRGEINVRIAPFDAYRSFSVNTEPAMLIVDEDAPAFSVKQGDGLTTLAVEEGIVMIQTENPEVQPINLMAGEQVSLNKEKMGPIVAVGAPSGLEEPKDLKHRLLDLGQLQECETLEGKQEVCGTWSWDRKAQAFNATWQNGVTAELKVEKMEGGEIVLVRRDVSGPSAGLTLRYFGVIAGNDMEGDVAVQLLKGAIVSGAPGSPSGGTWHTRSHYFLDLGQSE